MHFNSSERFMFRKNTENQHRVTLISKKQQYIMTLFLCHADYN